MHRQPTHGTTRAGCCRTCWRHTAPAPGCPFTAYGDEIRDHIEQLNRPMFVNDLTATWLPAVPDLDARLQADPPAWVVEIACGAGWSSIALAQSRTWL